MRNLYLDFPCSCVGLDASIATSSQELAIPNDVSMYMVQFAALSFFTAFDVQWPQKYLDTQVMLRNVNVIAFHKISKQVTFRKKLLNFSHN